MPIQTILTERLRLTYSIIQAPRAGGATAGERIRSVSPSRACSRRAKNQSSWMPG